MAGRAGHPRRRRGSSNGPSKTYIRSRQDRFGKKRKKGPGGTTSSLHGRGRSKGMGHPRSQEARDGHQLGRHGPCQIVHGKGKGHPRCLKRRKKAWGPGDNAGCRRAARAVHLSKKTELGGTGCPSQIMHGRGKGHPQCLKSRKKAGRPGDRRGASRQRGPSMKKRGRDGQGSGAMYKAGHHALEGKGPLDCAVSKNTTAQTRRTHTRLGTQQRRRPSQPARTGSNSSASGSEAAGTRERGTEPAGAPLRRNVTQPLGAT